MKTQIIGVIFLIAGFVLLMFQSSERDEQMREYHKQQLLNPKTEESSEESQNASGNTAEFASVSKEEAVNVFSENSKKEIVETSKEKLSEDTYTIENSFIKVEFTNYGGAIKTVSFIDQNAHGKLNYRSTLTDESPYIFNQHGLMPALGISWAQNGLDLKAFDPVYQLRSKTGNSIEFTLKTDQGMEIIREYTIAESDDSTDPYIIKHSTRFVNATGNSFNLQNIFLNAGTLPITEGDNYKMHLNFGYFDSAEDDVEFIKISDFLDGNEISTPFIQEQSSNNAITWGAVKNQFFTGVITPETNAKGAFVKAFHIDELDAYGKKKECITGNLEFNLNKLAAGTEKSLDVQYYVGPKEYSRLKDLGKHQDLVMEFGVWPFDWGLLVYISQKLLVFMIFIESMAINFFEDWSWGVSIILFTILIKAALWPLTAMQVKSSKKMQLIQEPMKELREKNKDNPQKQQQEMMKLFKENNVNPAAGCLPILIQIPIFIGLFGMLRTASELRFAEFLWVADLSVADSVSWLPEIPQFIPFFGGPIHILPILMGISMHYQMKMMPTPTTDNVQMKIFKFMPLVFFLFSWKFPAGLVLYWTVNNLLTMLQTHLTKGITVSTQSTGSGSGSSSQPKKLRKAKKR